MVLNIALYKTYKQPLKIKRAIIWYCVIYVHWLR